MNQLYLSNSPNDPVKQREILLIRLFSMLDMKYAGDIPLSHLSDLISHEEEHNTFNPYKLHAQMKTSFSNMFHGVMNQSINLPLMYGSLDPLTINRNEGIQPSPYYPAPETIADAEHKDSTTLSPAETQHSRKIAVSAILPENIPLQILAALSFLMQLTDDDFVGLVNHTPVHHILPGLLIGLTRRGHSILVHYIMARYSAIYAAKQKAKTENAAAAETVETPLGAMSTADTAATASEDIPATPWLAADSLGHTPLIVAAQRGHCYLVHALTSTPSVSVQALTLKDLGACYKALVSHVQEFCGAYPTFAQSSVGIAADYIVAFHRSIWENTPDSQIPAPIFMPRQFPQTPCPGRRNRTVNEVDVCDNMGFSPLLHAIACQQAVTAAFLIEIKLADHRWVSNGAVVATMLTEHVAESVKVAVEQAIAKRMAAKIAQSITHYTANEFKIDFPF